MAVFSKIPRPGKGALMVMRGDRLVVRWAEGHAAGTVVNSGGFLGGDDADEPVEPDLGLVWLALGSARRRGHDWILLEVTSWPSGILMDGACQVVVDGPHGEEPFGPMNLAGWLVRPGIGAHGLLVLTREDR